jgi:DNA-binding response OmpR family regulator
VTRGGRRSSSGRGSSRCSVSLRCAGKAISKTMILSHTREYNFDPQTNVVDVLVSRLRDKIDRPFEKKLLQTVRGVGYVLG